MSRAKGVSKGDRAQLNYERIKASAQELIRIGDLIQDISMSIATLNTLVLASDQEKEMIKKRMEEMENDETANGVRSESEEQA